MFCAKSSAVRLTTAGGGAGAVDDDNDDDTPTSSQPKHQHPPHAPPPPPSCKNAGPPSFKMSKSERSEVGPTASTPPSGTIAPSRVSTQPFGGSLHLLLLVDCCWFSPLHNKAWGLAHRPHPVAATDGWTKWGRIWRRLSQRTRGSGKRSYMRSSLQKEPTPETSLSS